MQKIKLKSDSYIGAREPAGAIPLLGSSYWESFPAWGADLEERGYDLGNQLGKKLYLIFFINTAIF